ncbi:hypothetical protein [Thalassomonas haliotis]|uniref:DUF3144 domain-containing protein n=1 Tax=Thalassomonas haliotis TaxID=485448 RepID=A0ABY7V9E2_9GAMM|nr:hypothetical protein [Thalassomonas haliotis]WDE09885.1 hypothetical protein H3N35_16350 [Thalassomonas haliotis]
MNTAKDKADAGALNEDSNAKGDTAHGEAKDDGKNAERKVISAEVLALSNDFNTFSADCAFLCEAFAAVANEQPNIDGYTAHGFNRYGLWIKEQVANFDERIEQLQEHIRALHR